MTEPRQGRESLRVLGIDPGTNIVGYGILDATGGGGRSLVAHGAIRLPRGPLAARLETIFREVRRIIELYEPKVLAIEEVFQGKSFQSVMKVGEARGVVVLAAQMAGLAIEEYAPARIKKAATGNGNAAKSQVQGMMGRILALGEKPGSPDVTDALAAAFCHAQRIRSWRLHPSPVRKAAARPRKAEATRSARRAEEPPRGVPRKGSPGRGTGPGVLSAAQLARLLRKGGGRILRGARYRKPRKEVE